MVTFESGISEEIIQLLANFGRFIIVNVNNITVGKISLMWRFICGKALGKNGVLVANHDRNLVSHLLVFLKGLANYFFLNNAIEKQKNQFSP